MTIHRLFAAIALLCALALSPSPAHAEWYEASSDHFVIYADDKESDIRRYAENLERYHSAMEYLTGKKFEKPSPSNRVVIFVVGSQRELQKIAGGQSRNIAGFYVPRAGASRAFVQDIRNKNGYPDFSTIVLLHEYAHHFLISSQRFEMPRWLGEGMAEFFAAATFEKDGGVLIGRVARHRAGELFYAQDVSVRELLDHDLYEKNKGKRYDAFYGRSWLLYHYLTFNPERRPQLRKYQTAIVEGQTSIEAANEAFGNLDQLQRELDQYMRGRRFMQLTLPSTDLPVGNIAFRKLPEGEAEMMPLRIRSQRGVNAEQAAELVVKVREVAAKYPGNPGVLAALAEAEFDSGNDAAAIAAADRAIAIDPKRTNPYVQKGFAMFRMAANAEDADAKEAAYEAAMEPFSKLNTLENDHPLPLVYYYRSYTERGATPPENARHALERAAQLAPFDKVLWFNVAVMQMQEGKIALARESLQPIANDPHGRGRAAGAKSLIALLDETAEGTSLNMREVLSKQGGELADEAADDTGDTGEGYRGDGDTGDGDTGDTETGDLNTGNEVGKETQ